MLQSCPLRPRRSIESAHSSSLYQTAPLPTLPSLYARPAINAQVRSVHDRIQELLAVEYEGAGNYKPAAKDWLASHWQGFMSPAQLSRIRNTGMVVACCWRAYCGTLAVLASMGPVSRY
jgi:hypothetical protein